MYVARAYSVLIIYNLVAWLYCRYLSPPHSQGFEAHFDWMDGLVVQLRGAKHWTLYAPLMVRIGIPPRVSFCLCYAPLFMYAYHFGVRRV